MRDIASRLDRCGLALLVVLFIALGTVYSLSVPLFEAPDEIWHFNFIRVLAAERALPQQPAEGKDMWLREAGQPPLYHLVSALLVAPLDSSDFPTWVRFNIAHPAVTPESTNEAPNVFIHTPAEVWPFRGSVLAVYLVRWSTLLWGVGAVIGTVLIARRVLPNRPGLALAAGALTVLNPHFLTISSVINNDAAAAGLCTLTLWACIRLVQETRRASAPALSQAAGMPNAVLLGILLGLSLLSKMSALALLPLVALALGLAWWGERDLGARAVGTLLLRACVVIGLAALVSGWWFVRNWWLYGDPLGWSVWLIDIGVQRIDLAELIRQFGHVATSYLSPYDGLLPRSVFWALGVGLAVAVAGWIGYLVALLKALPPLNPPRDLYGGEEEARARAGARFSSPPAPRGGLRGGRLHVDQEGLLLSGTWLVLLVASLVRYMTTTPSAEGRLLYPGIASASLLLALGWGMVFPRRWARPASGAALGALLLLCLVTPLFAIAPRFARPLVTRARELEGLMPVENGDWGDIRLLGVRVEPEIAAPGERIDVRLYWEVVDAPPTDLHAVIRLQTPGGRLLAQWDEPPANERYPSDLWRPGDVVRDDYSLPARGKAIEGGPAIYCVSVWLRREGPSGPPARTAYSLKRAPGTETLENADVEEVGYKLGEQVTLSGYSLPEGKTPSAQGLPLTLYWDVLAEMDEDHSVFVHLVAPDGTVLGQGDGPPLNGDYPTSSWAVDERLADPHLVKLQVEGKMERQPPGSYLLVGLYRLEDGTRLPVTDQNGARVPNDAIRIDLNAG